MHMTLSINNTTKSRINKKPLEKTYKRFLKAIKLHPKSSASLAFVTEAEIQKLNKKYRNKNTPTDVLSFSHLENQSNALLKKEPHFLGEVVICQKAATLPVDFLLAHGLLHLIGFDHKTDAQEKRMQQFEKKIIPKP